MVDFLMHGTYEYVYDLPMWIFPEISCFIVEKKVFLAAYEFIIHKC